MHTMWLWLHRENRRYWSFNCI